MPISTLGGAGGTSSAGYTPPTQTGNSGKFLTTNGTETSWGFSAPIQIATSSLTGVSSYTISSIPSTYKTLWIQCSDLRDASGEDVSFRINGLTAAEYTKTQLVGSSTTLSNVASSTLWQVGRTGSSINGYFDMYLPNYANKNSFKSFYSFAMYPNGPSAYNLGYNTNNTLKTQSITSITVSNNGVNWTGGTITLYGVN